MRAVGLWAPSSNSSHFCDNSTESSPPSFSHTAALLQLHAPPCSAFLVSGARILLITCPRWVIAPGTISSCSWVWWFSAGMGGAGTSHPVSRQRAELSQAGGLLLLGFMRLLPPLPRGEGAACLFQQLWLAQPVGALLLGHRLQASGARLRLRWDSPGLPWEPGVSQCWSNLETLPGLSRCWAAQWGEERGPNFPDYYSLANVLEFGGLMAKNVSMSDCPKGLMLM